MTSAGARSNIGHGDVRWQPSRRPVWFTWVLAVLLAIGLTSCSGSTKKVAVSASSSATQLTSVAASPVLSSATAPPATVTATDTATVTASATPSPSSASTVPTYSSKATRSSSAPTGAADVDPAAVVQKFYRELSDKNFSAAWQDGGRNLANGADYSSWVAGYADTTQVSGTAVDTGGGGVSTKLTALHLDGSVVHYAGAYTVRGKTIRSGHLHLVSSRPTSSPTDASQGCTTTSSGSCIKGGEFCKQSFYGQTGTDAEGRRYTCTGDHTHPHWEK